MTFRLPSCIGHWRVSVHVRPLHCIAVPGNEQLTANRKLQCATFLLQVCSTTLKSERGASHPERADQPCTVISSSTPTPTSPNIGCPNTSCVREDGSSTSSTGSINRLAARTCAELALAYLSKMLVAASELMGAEFAAGKTDDAWTKGRHSGKDAVFWVLSFVSDVLKHFSKQQWIFPGASSSEAQKHATDALRTPTEVTSAVTVTTTANSESAARDISIYVNKTSSDKFDVEGLAGVVADVPVQYACGMEDVALKWLEVIQARNLEGEDGYNILTFASCIVPWLCCYVRPGKLHQWGYRIYSNPTLHAGGNSRTLQRHI